MSLVIIKLDTPDGPRYLEYSTVWDAPSTWGKTLESFTHYYRVKYGTDGMVEFPARMKRVEETGTSVLGETIDDTLLCNRAGAGETWLTKDQIVDWYCVRRGHGDKPRGTDGPER